MIKNTMIEQFELKDDVVSTSVKVKRKPSRSTKKTVISENAIEVIKEDITTISCKCNNNEIECDENLTVTSLYVDNGIIENSHINKIQQYSDDKNKSVMSLVKNNSKDCIIEKSDDEDYVDEFKMENPKLLDEELKSETTKDENLENIAKETLLRATVKATEVLVSMLTDETATNSLKVDCAKEILNRVYGKTFVDVNQSTEKFSMSEDLLKYCE